MIGWIAVGVWLVGIPFAGIWADSLKRYGDFSPPETFFIVLAWPVFVLILLGWGFGSFYKIARKLTRE